MRLKVEPVGTGLHPSEVVVTVRTADGGIERIVISRRSMANNMVEVGTIAEQADRFLVELPRETQSGAWRIWVPKTQMAEPERIRT